MKKYTVKEIDKKFKKVILPKDTNTFTYNQKDNTINLNGVFSSDQLEEISNILDDVGRYTNEIIRIKSLKVNKFTVKDIKVQWFRFHDRYAYSFYIMKNGKDYDFYYGSTDEETKKWWPRLKSDLEDFYYSPIVRFIPHNFSESCENIYETNDSLEDTISFLKECGFTVEESDARGL